MKAARYKGYLLLLAVGMVLIFGVTLTYAAGQSSTNYSIEMDVLDGGGGEGSSTDYFLFHVIGQPSPVGNSSSSNYNLSSGYWVTAQATQFNPYDTDQDCIIGNFELLNAIDVWAGGGLGNFELLDLIDIWATGTYC